MLRISKNNLHAAAFVLSASLPDCWSDRLHKPSLLKPSATTFCAHAVCLYNLYGSQNEQRLFPYTTLIDWFFFFLHNRDGECTLCGTSGIQTHYSCQFCPWRVTNTKTPNTRNCSSSCTVTAPDTRAVCVQYWLGKDHHDPLLTPLSLVITVAREQV